MAIGTQVRRVEANLEAANAYWGKPRCRSIDYVADVASSLNDTYFEVSTYEADGDKKDWYVWYNVAAAGTDPAVSGRTGIEVAITAGATANAVMVATNAAMVTAGFESFISVSDTDTSLYENWYPGEVLAASETDAGSTGFTLTSLEEGYGGFLGKTSEGIELSFEVSTVEIKSNQTGDILADEALVGASISMSMSLIEMNDERFGFIVGKGAGDELTTGTSDLVGFGESKLFQNLNDQDGRLILHPIRLASTDRSADWVFWRAAPLPDTLNFDGAAPQVLAITFKSFLDSTKDTKINQAARGDWTQSVVQA